MGWGFFNPLVFHISRYSTVRQNVGLCWPAPGRPRYFGLLSEKEALSSSLQCHSLLNTQIVFVSAAFQTLLPKAGIYLPEILHASPSCSGVTFQSTLGEVIFI